jgi:hypothetical protein
MVLQRIQGAGVPRMPPLATNQLDPEAIQLINDWIVQSLPQRQNFPQWQTAHFGSVGASEAQANADPDGDGQDNQHEFFANTDPTVASSFLPPVTLTPSGNQLVLSFSQPANRSALVETTTDFATWALWDVPGNSPAYPVSPRTVTFQLIPNGNRAFFRLRLSAP